MNAKIIIIALFAVVVHSCGNNSPDEPASIAEPTYYTCVMHPEIVRGQPGQCPICGMELVEKKRPAGEDSLLPLLLSPNRFVVSQAAVTTPVRQTLPIELKASGLIEYDQRDQQVISAWVSGWIERLYVRYRYQPVSKGDKLMEIYSKQVVTEQANYLFLLEHDPGNTTLIRAAEKKLELLGLTTGQISELRETKKAHRLVAIYSPYNGHLHELNGQGMADPSMNGAMNGSTGTNEPTILKEGSAIQKGQPLFNIYGTDRVWAVLRVPGGYQNELHTGDPVTVHTTDGTGTDARIDYISPVLSAQQFLEIRVYLDNRNDRFSIGEPVDAQITMQPVSGLFVPASSVIFLGTRQVVFLSEENGFRVHDIVAGANTGDFVQVISGIAESDTLALHAQMLVDSESFIPPANEN